MPEAVVEERRAEALLVKPPERELGQPERLPTQPTHRAYDPFAVYYPSPMGTVLDAMMFASFMHMLMPPPVMVVNPSGAQLGSLADIKAEPALASDDRLATEHADAVAEHGAVDGAEHDHGAAADDSWVSGSWDDSDWSGGFDGGDLD